MLKRVTSEIPSLAISLNKDNLLVLLINPEFWENQGNETSKKIGLIKHELLHIALKHLIRKLQFAQETIFNIAADLVVNQYLTKEQLQKNALTIDRFPEFNLQALQNIDYYYKQLLKHWNKLREGQLQNKSASYKLLESLIVEKDQNLIKHDQWEGLSSNLYGNQLHLLERAIDANLRTTLNRVGWKVTGTLPKTLQLILDNLSKDQAKVNWRRMLRIFASSHGGSQLKNTLHRRSKRYGTSPGIKIKRNKHFVVGIDTSGSINQFDLKLFFNEIHQLWKQGHQLLIVEIDSIIQRKYLYRGKAPSFIQGRGGTDYNALIAWANRQGHLSDGIIYFTDGYSPVPTVKSRKPILWLISEKGIKNEDPAWQLLPGRKIKIT